MNQKLDAPTAEAISDIFTEVIIAPDADEAACEIIAGKKNLRLLLSDGLPAPHDDGLSVRNVAGGYLVQNRDNGHIDVGDVSCVTKRQPSAGEMADLLFAWQVAKHVKSNAIIYVKEQATVGIGAGQMSRLDSSRIAARKGIDAAKHAAQQRLWQKAQWLPQMLLPLCRRSVERGGSEASDYPARWLNTR